MVFQSHKKLSALRGLKAATLHSITLVLVVSCTAVPPPGGMPSEPQEVEWRQAFDSSDAGFLSAVWGSSPSDVFMVGGQPQQGAVRHFDGATWSEMSVPTVPVLVWVFGFASDDVYAVGEGGGIIRYDGSDWTAMDSPVTADLFGIWGVSSSDLWAVGGNESPVILHFDGISWSEREAPALDRTSTGLFKVWGTDGDHVFAIGQNGVILEFDGDQWSQVESGTVEDLVTLSGRSATDIIAVGGRTNGVIARYDGSRWQTESVAPVVGLNGVHMRPNGDSFFVGLLGTAGVESGGAIALEQSGTSLTLHAVWDDNAGNVYAVGGRSSETPFTGVALVRSER